MNMWRYGFFLFVLMVSGCTGLSVPAPVGQTQYLLDATPDVAISSTRRDAVLMVSASQARPGFDTSQMAYSAHSQQLDYFATNRWVAPPAQMLEPLLVAALEKAAAFRVVVADSNSLSEDLRLDVELIQLYQDFTTKPSRVVFSVRAHLTDQRNDRIISAHQFDEAETAASEDARGGAEAANRALKKLLVKLVDYCLTAAVDP